MPVARHCDYRKTARRKHARQLDDGRAVVGHVLEHLVADDQVETAVCEREPLDVFAGVVAAWLLEIGGAVLYVLRRTQDASEHLFGREVQRAPQVGARGKNAR